MISLLKKIMNNDPLPTDQNGCQCQDGCCQPKRRNPFKLILFIAILLAVAGILAFKFTTEKKEVPTSGACCPGQPASCCDTSAAAPADTVKNSSCCPE